MHLQILALYGANVKLVVAPVSVLAEAVFGVKAMHSRWNACFNLSLSTLAASITAL